MACLLSSHRDGVDLSLAVALAGTHHRLIARLIVVALRLVIVLIVVPRGLHMLTCRHARVPFILGLVRRRILDDVAFALDIVSLRRLILWPLSDLAANQLGSLMRFLDDLLSSASAR